MEPADPTRTGGVVSWVPPRLDDAVAVVTGASRGVGKGIALALGDAGATVYVTGRSVKPEVDEPAGAPKSHVW